MAVKVLAPHLAHSAAARKRFAREAQAAAAIVHPHVVAIHAVDAAGTLPYLVMPFIAGESLQDRLDRQGPLDVKETLRIGLQTAQGLAAAHAQGLIHRDVKPANILLEHGVDRVMLTDFGLARAMDDASLTRSTVIAGTPQYMSPEQARGETIDHRTDLFSLGSVLYAMCAGYPPFRSDTMLGVLRRVSEESPRAIRELNADVPPWLASVIHQLLAKRAEHRYQSAAEVADLLEKCLAHVQQPTVVPLPHIAGANQLAERKTSRTVGYILTAVAITGVIVLVTVGARSLLQRDGIDPMHEGTNASSAASHRMPAESTQTDPAAPEILRWHDDVELEILDVDSRLDWIESMELNDMTN